MPEIEFEAGDDVSASNFLEVPGIYHLCVTGIEAPVTDRNGAIVEGALFRLSCEVLDGTVPGQQGKQWDTTFYRPGPSDWENSRKFKEKKRDRFFIAVNLMKEDQVGQTVRVNTDHAMGEQFVAKLEQQMDRNTKLPTRYLQFAFADIYHVDDSNVAHVPKDQGSLKGIKPEKRRIGQQPISGAAKKAMDEAGKKSPPSVVDMDDV